MELEKRVHSAAREVALQGLAEAAHDLGDGGLAVALAECTFSGIGADVALTSTLSPQLALFHEGASRVLVATSKVEEVLALAQRHAIPAEVIGKTTASHLKISLNGAHLLTVGVDKLYKTWDEALEESLHV
jgi:phosphoribosylformylglycinamidine synthase